MKTPSKNNLVPEDHYYVYRFVPEMRSHNGRKMGAYVYERTTGTERSARERVKELESRNPKERAVYLKNHLISGAFY
jgi:hypothetical protein